MNYAMDEVTKMLDKMPEVIRVKDGDEIVDCRLSFYYSKEKRKWTAAYHCGVLDYFLSCGYGDTIAEAVEHLKRTIRNIKVKGDAGQYDYKL